MVDKQIPREDVVYEIVRQLADAVSKEGAFDIVQELVRVFKKVGENRELLTRDIWNVLRKLKTRKESGKRILPLEVVNLLKARMTITGKKKILERVLSLLENESLVSVKKISENEDGITLQLVMVPRKFQVFPAVDIMKDMDIVGDMEILDNMNIQDKMANLNKMDIMHKMENMDNIKSIGTKEILEKVIKDDLQNEVDIDMIKKTPKIEQIWVPPTQDFQSAGESVKKRVENEILEDGKEKQISQQLEDKHKIQSIEEEDKEAMTEEKEVKASYYQKYLTNLAGRRQTGHTGSKIVKTGRMNNYLEEHSGMKY